MSPWRDPHTGKFRSGDRPDNFDHESIAASITVTLPAADLGGGTLTEEVDGEQGELIDFTEPLNRDEIFELHSLQVSTTLSMPTTATAEGSAELAYQVVTDFAGPGPAGRPSFYGGPVEQEDGIADVNTFQDHEDDYLARGRLVASPSHSDTVNALAGGADNANENYIVPVHDLRLDENDELTVPMALAVNNVSDHAVVATVDVVAHGWIDDSEC